MKTITPHLWFDTQAKEATAFYASLIPNSKVESVTEIHNTPSGDSDIVVFQLAGQPFMAISAGPFFKLNPSVSFHIKCKTSEEVDALWAKLIEGGTARMELGSYPFSERYGWVEDKYGVNWQIISTAGKEFTQRIVPVLMFTQDKNGKTEEAINLYTSIFPNSNIQMLNRYTPEESESNAGLIKYGHFTLNGMEFGAMDGGLQHEFTFNEAISFVVQCETQEELDGYWEKLSTVPDAEQCGWCKDQFGVSWQIVPTKLGEFMTTGTEEQRTRVTQAFLKMKKFDIATLEQAFNGE